MGKLTCGVVLCLLLSTPASAGEAQLVLRVPASNPGISPKVSDAETGTVVEKDPGSTTDWIYPVEFDDGQIVRHLKLSIAGPDLGPLSELLMEHPFFREGDLLLVLSVRSNVSGGSGAVRAAWATSVRDMSSDQLLKFYQRASFIAKHRMNGLAGQWHRAHAYDVQSVFKYLESVVALSKHLYILPPNDVSDGRDWLVDAISNAPEAVEKGVRMANAQKLIQDVDSEEGLRFGTLWRAIRAEPCEKRKLYLKGYRDWFLKVPTDQRRERIEKATGVRLAEIESAVAQCVASEAQKAVSTGTAEDKETAKAEVVQQIESLASAKQETGTTSWTKKLDRDISNLTNILSAF